MIESLLANLDTLLLYVFAACALAGSALMLMLRQPMRVAMALISTMIFLGGIYGLLGVHFIAAFQVLLVGVLAYALLHGLYAPASSTVFFGLQQFSATFLNEYWLQFEVTSVLLVAAVVAALAVIKGSAREHG